MRLRRSIASLHRAAVAKKRARRQAVRVGKRFEQLGREAVGEIVGNIFATA
jgi:hypothetical protein